MLTQKEYVQKQELVNPVALADFLLFSFDNILESQINKKSKMDAIRKKMKSIKDETDQLYAIIQKFEDATKEANRVADQVENPQLLC